MEEKINLTKENLYEYYIVQNHSRKECSEHFQCKLSQLKQILLKERIVKMPLKYDLISDSEVYEYYVTQNHNLSDTCKHFNCNGQIILDKIHKLGVRKAAPKGYAGTITKEELCDYYIINNHTLVETSVYFKISTGTLISLLNKYGISKDSKLRIDNIKKTCLEKYGVENIAHSIERTRLRSGRYRFENNNFDSKWELYLYIYAIDHGEDISRCPCSFDYMYNNKKYTYIPDFLYNDEIVEIKGEQFFDKNNHFVNPYDHSLDGRWEAKYKCMIENNVKILREKDLKHIFSYIKEVYGKAYYKQFKIK